MLKCRAGPGFYAGGKHGRRGSVNSCFFGVNIVLFTPYPPGRDVNQKRLIMYLSIINLDTPGQSVRLLLWIFVPMGICYLLYIAWTRYRRPGKAAAGGLRLAVEGFGGYGADGKEGYGGAAGDGYANAAGTTAGVSDEVSEEDSDEVSEEEAGKETIYRGILWMKEKYEQYREQADRKYELLREELGRSEKRYQDLLLSIEQNKNDTPEMIATPREEALLAGMSAGEGEILADSGPVQRPLGKPVGHSDTVLAEVRDELGAKQVVIEELEEQLRMERLKVEELVMKLKTNSQLLLNIYRELDKSIDTTPKSPGPII